MLRPLMAARVEKPDDPSGARITPRDVRPLMVVAGEAGERQVLGRSQSAVLAREDVVNLKGEFIVLLRHLAVLADAPGAPPDQTFEAKVHSRAQLAVRTFFRAWRALDFISDNT
jgi:hypothetical protein